ncbi:hypothetical protein NCAS_0C00630 [Naumovozyma castellii]|uniref:EamA domain-containing protein n=1 Tax=Naumovozyma castellii TaxID=27288 RepID=G0VC46_NAUCA|nr:hypothetical protein NCAS_0C00630 [Naumovozyma castellii CBS 4309]CCC69053.1 hypothetical protein NCAS_0C00630 [Naumovozyma castellii CBS 4309]
MTIQNPKVDFTISDDEDEIDTDLPLSPITLEQKSFQHPLSNIIESDNDIIAEENEEDDEQTPTSELQRINKEYLKPNIGLILLIFAQLFNSLMVTSTKVLETDPEDKALGTSIKPFQILLVRMAITYLGTLIYMYLNRSTIDYVPFGDPKVRKWLILRGCVGFWGVFGMYFSLMYLSISDAVLITFLAPTVTIILAWIILRERFTKVEAAGALVSLLGVVLIVRPTFLFGSDMTTPSDVELDVDLNPMRDQAESSNPADRLMASIVGLCGVLGMSSVYIIIRFIGKRAHAIMSVSYFSLITLIISTVCIIVMPSMRLQFPHSLKQWLLFANLGFCGFFFQLLLTLGIQKERAGRGSLMSYTQLVYAIFWDVTLYKNWPSIWSWLGMIIIIGSTLVVMRLKPKQNKDGSLVVDEPHDEESTPVIVGEISRDVSSPVFKLEDFPKSNVTSNSTSSIPIVTRR